ncbi:glycosyltransferase [Devosia nitrariae]|uniref:Mannosyltransferase n=1 Tax=Devosia nitrariae TaxID=2071872 RepID=A0ABQ5W4H8_9HYPH|nr:glycosyltransferase [Devosia nitrariae]GLQ54962.1 mannosyltransferase [Devosia nitrariae]
MDRRIAIFHDYFAIRGGGERLVLTLCQAMDAALIYGYRTSESYDERPFPRHSRSLGLQGFRNIRGVRLFALAAAFAARRGLAKAFPIRIFSGVAACFAAPAKGAGGVNIFYCHTPPRFLYDQKDYYLRTLPPWLRVLAALPLTFYERAYRLAVSRMDVVITNSQNTRDRLKQFMDLDSIVVYPPVDTDSFRWTGQADYYLSTARLSKLKRVDRIVAAFRQLPDKKLIVVSGGEEQDALVRMSRDANNIEFKGWVDDEALRQLVGQAVATLYLPIDEDFGISPVEAMAAGKPVIGVAEGGLLETVLPERTGLLLPPNFSDDDLVQAVREMTPERAWSMREACETQASRFAREGFVAAVKAVIADVAHRDRDRDQDASRT